MPDSDLQIGQASQALLTRIIKRLIEDGVTFAIIHNSNGDCFDTSSDIDIAFEQDPRIILGPLLDNLSTIAEIRIVQRLHYEVPYGYYYILSPRDNPFDFLHLDCLHDPYGINRYHLSTDFLLHDIDRSAWFPKVNPENCAIYLLIKRALKGKAVTQQIHTIRDHLTTPGTYAMAMLSDSTGVASANDLQQLLDVDTEAETTRLLSDLRTLIQHRFLKRHPFRAIAAKSWTVFRLLSRLMAPSGVFVVLIGPDGSGKSTINYLLQKELARGYRRVFHFHWRPGLLPKLGRREVASSPAETNQETPATRSKYGTTLSLIRFMYYWLDFVLGYWLRLYPMKAASTLIIGERYFLDILVHPARYGFSLPRWFLRFASFLVPSPDATILLSNAPETIHRRKAELPLDVIRSQLTGYQKEISYWGESIIAVTDGTPESVARKIGTEIIRISAQKYGAHNHHE